MYTGRGSSDGQIACCCATKSNDPKGCSAHGHQAYRDATHRNETSADATHGEDARRPTSHREYTFSHAAEGYEPRCSSPKSKDATCAVADCNDTVSAGFGVFESVVPHCN